MQTLLTPTGDLSLEDCDRNLNYYVEHMKNAKRLSHRQCMREINYWLDKRLELMDALRDQEN